MVHRDLEAKRKGVENEATLVIYISRLDLSEVKFNPGRKKGKDQNGSWLLTVSSSIPESEKVRFRISDLEN